MTKEEVEQEIRNVRRQLVRSMNGVVAHRMLQSGVSYKKNYGVELPRLYQLSVSLPHDEHLAIALWNLSIRETMLLALMIYPIDKFSELEFREWIKQIPTYEVAEVGAQRLFSRVPYATEQISLLLEGDNFEVVCGYLIAAKLLSTLSDEFAIQLKKAALEQLNSPILFNAILVFFRCIVQQKRHLCNDILEKLDKQKDTFPRVNLLYEEVKTQLKYS